jgi:hypothetical protein
LRHTYWTIVLADGPTSFRARDRDSLLPTLRQLQSRNPAAALMWHANGRLWDSPQQAYEQAGRVRRVWRKAGGSKGRSGGGQRDRRDGQPDGRQRRPYRPTGGTRRHGGKGRK